MTNDIWKISALFGLSIYHLANENFLRHDANLLRQQSASSCHLYTMIVADTIARHKRQRGIETFFLTAPTSTE